MASDVRLGDGLFPDVVGQGPQQRHALGRGERQVKTVHRPLVNARPRAPLGAIPSSSHRAATAVSANPPSATAPSQSGQLTHPAASPATIHVGTRVSLSE